MYYFPGISDSAVCWEASEQIKRILHRSCPELNDEIRRYQCARAQEKLFDAANHIAPHDADLDMDKAVAALEYLLNNGRAED